jgi:CubicO group peptidase (beta-lactamase class C family)
MTPQQGSITLRQLLTMTSGISEEGFNLTADDPVAQILTFWMLNDPGVAFEYSEGSSAHLVAVVLHNAVDPRTPGHPPAASTSQGSRGQPMARVSTWEHSV